MSKGKKGKRKGKKMQITKNRKYNETPVNWMAITLKDNDVKGFKLDRTTKTTTRKNKNKSRWTMLNLWRP